MSLLLSAMPVTFSAQVAQAELLAQNNRTRRLNYSNVVREGTKIEVTAKKGDKILVTPDEELDVTLEVAKSVTNRDGQVLIPRGSDIKGRIEPSRNGARFVAKSIIIDREEYDLDATSKVVTRRETVNQGTNTDAILQGAIIGAAAATVLAAVTGDTAIATEEVLGGAGLGALAGWILGGEDQAELISIYPERDLDLTVGSDFELPY